MLQVDDEPHWLYAVGPEANQIDHTRLFQPRTTQLIVVVLARAPRETADRADRVPRRCSCAPRRCVRTTRPRLHVGRRGNRNDIENVLGDMNHRSYLYLYIWRRRDSNRGSVAPGLRRPVKSMPKVTRHGCRPTEEGFETFLRLHHRIQKSTSHHEHDTIVEFVFRWQVLPTVFVYLHCLADQTVYRSPTNVVVVIERPRSAVSRP